jgi:glycosyltransferase involved in cell wall biosynthesis
MSGRIWITWENQRRNRELSAALGAKLFEFKEIDDMKNPLKKYFRGLRKTIIALMKERPDLVFCQNPSLVLSALLVSIRYVAGFKVCVDVHNAGLFPKENRSPFLGLISRYIQRMADLTLVTNVGMKSHVEKNHGRAFVLPDKIPNFSLKNTKKLRGDFNILFICSYAEDEPYKIVFDAAKNIDSGTCIYVTGNFRKRKIDPATLNSNIILLGYISENDYVEMLNSVDATLDLTTREDCLLCGAYESVAATKPQILSDTHALRNYFSKGAIYSAHTVGGIQAAISEIKNRAARLTIETKKLKHDLQHDWDKKRQDLEKILSTF